MSLLLDALNKADRERKHQESTPGINSNHEMSQDIEAHPSLLGIAAIALLAIIAITAIIYVLKPFTKTPTATHPIVTTTQTTSKSTSSAITHSITNIQTTALSTEITHADNDSTDENVASLYQQTAENSQPANVIATVATYDHSNASTAIASPNTLQQFANLPEIHDLPKEVQNRIPSFNYTEHHPTNTGGSVVVNGAVKHVDEEIVPGVVIEKILDDGMILHFENFSFKMRALNSWVNM